MSEPEQQLLLRGGVAMVAGWSLEGLSVSLSVSLRGWSVSLSVCLSVSACELRLNVANLEQEERVWVV